jgi:hypothetical protein
MQNAIPDMGILCRVSAVLLGRGERLFDDLGDSAGSYRCVEHIGSPAVTRVRITRDWS